MTRRVITVPPTFPLEAAFRVMQREQIRHLPVTQGGLLQGILSDRDLLRVARVLDDDSLAFPDQSVAVAMTAAPFVCTTRTDVTDLVRAMVEHKIDAVPVMGTDDRLAGLVTSTDLMLLLIHYDEARPLPFDWQLEEVPLVASA